ncbi:M28 family metallopeptidase [Gaoshiqia sp. Z1-71]|uniref:M28 family metallopeptidase n=1 Tax=Gaoshiqia hydrogeniformans TaxID=3290090 RepID=UPI003BF79C4A
MIKLSMALFFILASLFAQTQDLNYARNVIEKLSSPQFKGRGYVGNGDRLSAQYIAGQYREHGLLPLSATSYFQEFSLSANTLPNRVSVKIDGVELQIAREFLLDPSSPSVKGSYPVVKTTRAEIVNEDQMRTVAAGARGAFLLIDSRHKKDEDPELSKKIDENIRQLKLSSPEVMKGILVLSDEKLTWRASTSQSLIPVITVKKELDLSRVSRVEIVADARLIDDYKTSNVAGFIRGTSPADSCIVALAHYDHLGMMGKKVFFPGANDNASGVAMLLNMAKHYAVNKPKYNMVFICLAAEEMGILGAKAFVENPLIDLAKIKFLVNFDQAGTGDEGIKVVNGTVFQKEFDRLCSINDEQKLLPAVEIRGESCNSDHCPFYQKGVPAFFIYTLGGSKAYHDIDDRLEGLSLAGFEGYFRLMTSFFDSI